MTTLCADGFTYNAEASDVVQKLLALTTPKTALDVGAGAGRNVAPLLAMGCHVVAVECGPESLNILHDMSKESAGLEVVDSTLQTYETNQRFDAVVCTMTLHFLSEREIPEAMEKLQSFVKPGGYICLSSYLSCSENDTLPHYYTFRFGPNELAQYFEGWNIAYYTEDYPVPSARVLNSGVNGGKGYRSARIVAQKL